MRGFLHTFFSILLWILFGYYWYVVSGRQISWSTFQAVGILAIVVLVGLLVTFWWVRHNIGLAGKNRRSGPPAPARELLSRDYLDRPIVSPGMEQLKAARNLVISLDDQQRKVYTAGPDRAS